MSTRSEKASDVRESWSESLDAVRYKGERIVITKSGKDAAALVSTEDLELLELLEDRIDIELAREALAESDERIPFANLKAELGF